MARFISFRVYAGVLLGAVFFINTAFPAEFERVEAFHEEMRATIPDCRILDRSCLSKELEARALYKDRIFQKWHAIITVGMEGTDICQLERDNDNPDRFMSEMHRCAKQLDDNSLSAENFRRLEDIIRVHGWIAGDEWTASAQEGAIEFLFSGLYSEDMSTSSAAIAIAEANLKTIREAADSGLTTHTAYAFIVDGIAWKRGRKQVYGTRFSYMCDQPEEMKKILIDPQSVNERRAEIDLKPLRESSNCDLPSEWP